MKYSVAIATWEKGASWRAQGRRVRMATRSDRPCNPSQVAGIPSVLLKISEGGTR